MNPSESQFPPRPTALVQQMLGGMICEGDLVIDATAGNGHDTLLLAACVGESGRVLAFDVQEAAIISARGKVSAAGLANRVEFYQESHERMGDHAAEESVAVVMFNLGYLPGEDHERTTETGTTLGALDVAVGILKPHGVLAVVCYPGHPAGAKEAEAVEAWMTVRVAQGWRVAKYGAIGTRKPAPFLLVAAK